MGIDDLNIRPSGYEPLLYQLAICPYEAETRLGRAPTGYEPASLL